MQSKLTFAHLPTAVENLPRLSEKLNGPDILIKRDDQTGLAFGGNKTRKLEFLLSDAKAQGAETLITAGAVQSNHCRQTAAAAARNGFRCRLVLTGDRPSKPSGNNFLDIFLGAELVWAGASDRELVLERTFEDVKDAGENPYLIPYGGSNAVGALGYVYAMKEMLEQMKAPDYIIFASSSGGTQAGLTVGGRMFGYPGGILGVSIEYPADKVSNKVTQIANETTQVLNLQYSFTPQDILVNDNYLGEGYGIMGEPEVEALTMFARSEGILLDPVYTGRAAAGLIDLIRSGFFTANQRVLFWHTGGTPALFADRYMGNLLD